MINVEGLTKDYGARLAVDNLHFQAEKGEIVGFLGPNGAGKTTTMRMLTGYMPPTSGSAKVAGFDVVEESLEVRRRVGYLPETVPLYEDMTVFDYLKFMADLRNLEDVDDRVEDVLEMVNLEDRVDSYISSLSKGMRQRVGLAQALLHDPDVLILDEPTIGLDPVQIIEIRKLIKELGKEHTILLSTHILSEAQAVCDRVLIINKGKIVEEGAPDQLEKRLSGGKLITVQVAQDAEKAKELLEQLAGISLVQLTSETELQLTADADMDARPAIAKLIVENGLDLLELRSKKMSLEDIFIELTQEDEEELIEEETEAEEEVEDEIEEDADFDENEVEEEA